jgi:hypothetical protein
MKIDPGSQAMLTFFPQKYEWLMLVWLVGGIYE